MKSFQFLSSLGFVLLAMLALAGTAEAKPQLCEFQCTSTTPCGTWCTTFTGDVITCQQWGVCDTGGCSCQTYIYGTNNPDTLPGDAYNNCIYGYDGDDTIHGKAGGDKLYGGNDDDTLYGDSGDDCLYGGPGWDHLDGGTGNDYCTQGEAYVSCERIR